MKRGDAAISIYGCLHAAFFLIASHHEAQSPRPRIRSCLGGGSISRGANIMQAAVCLLFCARLSARWPDEMEGWTGLGTEQKSLQNNQEAPRRQLSSREVRI